MKAESGNPSGLSNKDFVEGLFERIDKNGDKNISLDELKEFFQSLLEDSSKGEKTGGGNLGGDGKGGGQPMGGPDEGKTDDLLELLLKLMTAILDKDGDGQISKEEGKRLLSDEKFFELDADGNGSLNQEELSDMYAVSATSAGEQAGDDD